MTVMFSDKLLDLMIEEVRLHLVTEVPEYIDLQEDAPALMFIKNKVRQGLIHLKYVLNIKCIDEVLNLILM